MHVTGIETRKHQAETIATQTLPKEASQFRVTIGHVVFLCWAILLGQSSDHLTQRHKWFVDINTFFACDVTGETLSFTASQIN